MSWRNRDAARDEALVVAFAERLCAVAALAEPRPEFRAALRTALLEQAVATSVQTPAGPSQPAHRATRPLIRRRVAIATALVVTSLGLGGMASASASALPGETLYPVKRATEQVELAFKRGHADRGAFHLELADTRLGEARDLVDEKPPSSDELATKSVGDFTDEAKSGADDLVADFRATQTRSSIVTLNKFSTASMVTLTNLESELPAQASAVLAAARDRLTAITSLTAQLCPDCGGGPTDVATSPAGGSAQPAAAPPPAATLPGAAIGPAPPPAPAGDTSSGSDHNTQDDSSTASDNSDTTPTVPSASATPKPTSSPTPAPSHSPTPSPTPTSDGNNGGGNDGGDGRGCSERSHPIDKVIGHVDCAIDKTGLGLPDVPLIGH